MTRRCDIEGCQTRYPERTAQRYQISIDRIDDDGSFADKAPLRMDLDMCDHHLEVVTTYLSELLDK